MKVYAAIVYLDRSEWSGDTVWSWFRNGFELLVRSLMQNERGRMIAAHASLFFEDASDEVAADVSEFTGKRDFFIDVLEDGNHAVSTLDDPHSWYRRWETGRVDLHPVLEAEGFDAAAVYYRAIEFVRRRSRYDCYQNCNSICECWPLRCSPSFGVCCPFWNGTNCVDSVVVSLAAGFGGEEFEAEGVLGIRRRVARGARLPSKLRDELIEAGVVSKTPRSVLLGAGGSVESRMPLLAITN